MTTSAPATPTKSITHVPSFTCIYAPSKTGKTTDCLYAMPRAFLIGLPAAFKPSEGVIGFSIHPSQIWAGAKRISDVTKMLPKLTKDFDGAIVDDFSILAEMTLAVLEHSKSGFKLWGALRDEVLEFRDAARSCGMHVFVNCHESSPTTKNGMFIRGGPKLPGRLPEELPVHCDLVLRAFAEPSRKGPWPVVYRCTPSDPSYVTGDRHGVTPDYAPMNVGEILRAANYALRRAPGLEWMDEIVEYIATTAATLPAERHHELAQVVAQHMFTKHTQNLMHIRWALRDGFDRWTLRKARSNILSSFLTAPNALGLPGLPPAT